MKTHRGRGRTSSDAEMTDMAAADGTQYMPGDTPIPLDIASIR